MTILKTDRPGKNGSSPSGRREAPVRRDVGQTLGDAANQWLARNRSLVLRQTPVWAQAMTGILVSLGTLAVVGGIFFRIDEVVTVQGKLESIGGSVDVMTPAGGKVEKVFFNTPADRPDVLIAFHPAALRGNANDVRPGGMIILNIEPSIRRL